MPVHQSSPAKVVDAVEAASSLPGWVRSTITVITVLVALGVGVGIVWTGLNDTVEHAANALTCLDDKVKTLEGRTAALEHISIAEGERWKYLFERLDRMEAKIDKALGD